MRQKWIWKKKNMRRADEKGFSYMREWCVFMQYSTAVHLLCWCSSSTKTFIFSREGLTHGSRLLLFLSRSRRNFHTGPDVFLRHKCQFCDGEEVFWHAIIMPFVHITLFSYTYFLLRANCLCPPRNGKENRSRQLIMRWSEKLSLSRNSSRLANC